MPATAKGILIAMETVTVLMLHYLNCILAEVPLVALAMGAIPVTGTLIVTMTVTVLMLPTLKLILEEVALTTHARSAFKECGAAIS